MMLKTQRPSGQKNKPKKGNKPNSGKKRAAVRQAGGSSSSKFDKMGHPGIDVASSLSLRNPRLEQYARQIVVPEMASELLVSPSFKNATVCARKFTRVVDFGQAAFPGHLNIAMFPDLFRPCYASGSGLQVLPAAGFGQVEIHSVGTYFNAAGTMDHSGIEHDGMRVVDFEGGEYAAHYESIADSGGALRSGFNLVANPAVVSTTFIFTRKSSRVADITILTKQAGAWVTLVASVQVGVVATTYKTNLPAATTAVAFTASPGSEHVSIDMEIIMSSAQVISSAVVLIPAFAKQVVDQRITQGRVVSMSMLVTNTSSLVANGGSINMGRVPYNFMLNAQSASEMAKLPDNRRYQGPLSAGGYCWWLASKLDETTVDSIAEMRENYRTSEYLACRLEEWPVGASVRVTLHWIVEFYTPSQLFEKIVTPRVSEEYSSLLYSLGRLPAASCNPEHLEKFKEYLSRAGSAIKSGADYYADNRETINSALAVLAMLAQAFA